MICVFFFLSQCYFSITYLTHLSSGFFPFLFSNRLTSVHVKQATPGKIKKKNIATHHFLWSRFLAEHKGALNYLANA